MALDVNDHALLGMAQRQHQQFLARLHQGELRELRERLAIKTAANEGHLAILNALVDAYEQGDRATVDDILGYYERRNRIYRAAFNPVYNTLKP